MIFCSIRNRSESATNATPHSKPMNLLSDVQLLDDSTVSLNVVLLEVAEKVSSVSYHLLKAAAAVVVLVVSLEVLGKVLDSVGKKCDLYFGRTCVALFCSVLLNNCLLFVFQHFWYSPFKNIFIANSAYGG